MNSVTSVLVVDDERSPRTLVARWLESDGLRTTPVENADEALSAMSHDPASVALCDIVMPGHDGVWLAGELRQHFPDTAVIMTTGMPEAERAAENFPAGVVDYLVKPFGQHRLRQAVNRGLEWNRTAIDRRRWSEALEQESRARRVWLNETIAGIRNGSDDALDVLLRTLTEGQSAAYEHARRVARLAVRVGAAAGIPETDLADLERAALLHDVGKLAMPDALIRKPAPLTPDERQVMRTHVRLAYEALKDHAFLSGAADIVVAVPECYDGRGYPRGLRGDEIPLASRVVAAVDAYETMIARRVYRDAMPAAEAVLELLRCRGTQFDPDVVTSLLAVIAH